MLENDALVRGRLLQIDAGAWRGVPDAELRLLLENGLIEAFDVITHQVVVDPKRRFDYRLTAAQNLLRRAFRETAGAAPRVREAEAVAYG